MSWLIKIFLKTNHLHKFNEAGCLHLYESTVKKFCVIIARNHFDNFDKYRQRHVQKFFEGCSKTFTQKFRKNLLTNFDG